MALDVYVGPLVRYYRGDWENLGQRWARESGVIYMLIRGAVQPEPPAPVEELVAAIEGWQRYLSDGLAERLKEPIRWHEDPQGEYRTDRPGFEGLSALRLWAAYTEQPSLRPPARLSTDYRKDPAYQASTARGFRSRFKHVLHELVIWFPCEFRFTFRGPHLGKGNIGMGSSLALLDELHELKETGWDRFGDSPQAPPHDEADLSLVDAARRGYRIMEKLARFSVEQRVPIKLDY